MVDVGHARAAGRLDAVDPASPSGQRGGAPPTFLVRPIPPLVVLDAPITKTIEALRVPDQTGTIGLLQGVEAALRVLAIMRHNEALLAQRFRGLPEVPIIGVAPLDVLLRLFSQFAFFGRVPS